MTADPVRLYLVPGVAFAAAGALALAPVSTAPAALQAAPRVQVQVADVALAGIGLDIYEAITPWVQYVVGGGSYLINFIPLVGGPTAAQININYFQGIQPTVEATVDYLAAVVQSPLNFFPITAAYLGALYDIGYNWVSAQLRFIGLQPLAPLPQGAASVPADPAPAGPGERGAAPTVSEHVVNSPPLSDYPTAPSDSSAAPHRESLNVVRESLRGGHSNIQSARAERNAAAVAVADAPENTAPAPARSGKAAAARNTASARG